MSEQLIQNSIFSTPVIFDKYECYSIGATTVNNLIKSNIIKNVNLKRSLGNKKPDVLILDDNKNVIIYVEQKIPSKKFLLLCEKSPETIKLSSGKNSEMQNKVIS